MKLFFSRKTLFLSLGTLCILALFVISPVFFHSLKSHDECTSWIALGDASSGSNIYLHKNRDLSDTDPDHHQFRRSSNGLYRYIAMAKDQEPDALHVWAGINETGLAVASNLGGGINLYGGIGGPSTCREILENCDSVDCAWQWIDDNKSRYYYENIMFIVEPQKGTQNARGAVVEIHSNSLFGGIEITSEADSIFESDEQVIINEDLDGDPILDENGDPLTITNKPGVNFRSNHFKILSNSPWSPSQNSQDRYARLVNLFGRTSAEGGVYGLVDVSVSQAVGALAATSGKEDAFCRTSTLGRMTMAIDSSDILNSVLYNGDGYDPNLCAQTTPADYHFDFDFEDIEAYTFEGVVPADTDINIYECDVDQFPFGGNTAYLNSKTEADVYEYADISSPDGESWSTADPGSYDEMMLWVEMTINEDPEDIQSIEFVFQGYSSEDNDFAIYVKTVSGDWEDDSSWVQLGDVSEFISNSNDSIRRALDTDIADYIDANGMITWMVGTPEGHSDSITADFVKIEVITE